MSIELYELNDTILGDTTPHLDLGIAHYCFRLASEWMNPLLNSSEDLWNLASSITLILINAYSSICQSSFWVDLQDPLLSFRFIYI